MRRSLRSWLWRVPIDQEVDEELALHAEMRRREGRPLDPAEVDQVRRACLAIARERDRRMTLTRWAHEVGADARFALRQLRRAPGFTAVAVLTLALGIGANSAIFALVDATLLRPLPFADPDRLVAVLQRTAALPVFPVSPPTFRDIVEQNRTFDGLSVIATGIGGGPLVTAPDGSVASAERQTVGSGFFDLLGVRPVAGRTFKPADEAPQPAVVIFSESLWRSRFNADPSLIGRIVRLNGQPHTLVGVVPDNAQFTRRAQMWTLMGQLPPQLDLRTFAIFEVAGRLKPGVTLEEARADLAAIAQRIARQDPAATALVLDAEPLQQWLMGSDLRLTSWLLLGVVGFVLLLCCANVANLLLARGTARTREIAVRTALGAGRGRIAVQLLVESVVLALLGGTLGVALGGVIVETAPALIPPGMLPYAVQLGFDARVATFGGLAALAVGVLFGLAPVWQATSRSLLGALTSGSRSATAGGRFRGVLAGGEVAAAVVLLCGAGLLLRTLLVLVQHDPGYRVDADRVMTMDFSLSVGPNTPRPTPDALLPFYDRVTRELEAFPEVKRVGYSSSLPYGASELGPWAVEVVGEPLVPGSTPPRADIAIATDGYFRTLDVPIVRGRRFTDDDRLTGPQVCIVSEAFVRQVLKGRDPLGVRISIQRTPQTPRRVQEIVGVSRQTIGRPAGLEDSAQVYIPLSQQPTGDVFIVAEAASGTAEALIPLIRSVVARHDPNTPVRRERTLADLAVQSTAAYRFRAALVGAFAALALLLAMIGVFGVLAYSVQQRRREFGVRIALGATASSVLRLVLRGASRLIVSGAAAGLALAFLLRESIATFLYGVEPLDAVTVAGVVGTLALTAAAATLTPAWRAARVDPVETFREQ